MFPSIGTGSVALGTDYKVLPVACHDSLAVDGFCWLSVGLRSVDYFRAIGTSGYDALITASGLVGLIDAVKCWLLALFPRG